MATWLVTGAAGFIGSTLTEALLARGDSVVGLDAFTDAYSPEIKLANLAIALKHPGFHLIKGDIRQLDLEPLLANCDGVFHLAAQAGVRRSWRSDFGIYLDRNVLATQHLLEAVAALERPIRVVYASSSSVYGNRAPQPSPEEVPLHPHSPYGVTKLAAEMLCDLYHANFALDVVSLRFFTVFGPRQRPDMAFTRFLAQHASGSPLTLFGAEGSYRDYTFVGDIVRGILLAMEKGVAGGVYNLGGGHTLTLGEVVRLLGELLGQPVPGEAQPPVPGDVRGTSGDTSRAQRELGWHPQTEFRDGLAKQVAWFGNLPVALREACVKEL